MDGWPTADNETLQIFEDFLVILDDPTMLNESLSSGDTTIENIINNIRTNDSNFQIIFDPNNIRFEGPNGEFLDPNEVALLDQIKTQINNAVGSLAEKCTTHLCIQSLDENQPSTNVTVLPTGERPKEGIGGLILVEPKTDLSLKLGLCQTAQSCSNPATVCLFAQDRCLQLSGVDRLPPPTRTQLVDCKISTIQCSLAAGSMERQASCKTSFKTCAADLGVDISGSSVMSNDQSTKKASAGSMAETTERLGLDSSGLEEMDDVDQSSPTNLNDKTNGKNSGDPENSADSAVSNIDLSEIIVKAGAQANDERAQTKTSEAPIATLPPISQTDSSDNTKDDSTDGDNRFTNVSSQGEQTTIANEKSQPELLAEVDGPDESTEVPLGRDDLGGSSQIQSTRESEDELNRPLTTGPFDSVVTDEIVTEDDNGTGMPADAGTEEDNRDAISATPTGQTQEADSAVKEDYSITTEAVTEEEEIRVPDMDGSTQPSDTSLAPTQKNAEAANMPESDGVTDSKLEAGGVVDTTPLSDVQEISEDGTADIIMQLPGLGFNISLKPDETDTKEPAGNTSFGMSLPMFGFNVTLNKEATQCLDGTKVYNDFEEIPNQVSNDLCDTVTV